MHHTCLKLGSAICAPALLFVAIVQCAAATPAANGASMPNIIFILADDLGYGDLAATASFVGWDAVPPKAESPMIPVGLCPSLRPSSSQPADA
jgi:hypothetical protein